MVAQVVRQDRLGDRGGVPDRGDRYPELGPDEVLVAVMAAGINYNNVWAAQGIPIDVIAARQREGEPTTSTSAASDASGIV